ncbi:MAG TPA: hypothetical protein VMT50_06555 [Steroidobacteraceae bacterium]|nr:hypothetical protein [Steroidobacteraceae bacterium]
MRPPPDLHGRFRPAAAATLAVLALSLAPFSLQAQEGEATGSQTDPVATGSGPLEVRVEAQALKITRQPDGSELRRWHTATRLAAGEEVYYTVRVSNRGKVAVTGVVVTKRMPFGVAYLRGSATGPACEVQFSSDGGKIFAPAAPQDSGARGKAARTTPVPTYTHLRWILSRPLVPGATALLRFRAIFTG